MDEDAPEIVIHHMYGTRIQHFIIDANERLTVLFRDKRTTQMACERHFSFFFFAFLLLVLISREFCFKYDGYQIRVTRDWIDLCTVYFCFAMLYYAMLCLYTVWWLGGLFWCARVFVNEYKWKHIYVKQKRWTLWVHISTKASTLVKWRMSI